MAWVKIRVAETGYYYIRTINEYYLNSGVPFCLREETRYGLEIMVEGIEIEEETKYGLTTVDYGIVAELQGGKDYWLEYYHMKEAMDLSIETNVFRVHYDMNGGESDISDQAKLPSEGVTITTRDIQRDRYVFLGWATTPNATEPEYVGGDIYTADANLTLYAVWREPVEINVIGSEDIWTVDYPIKERMAWVKIRVAETGYYYIRTINEYYLNSGVPFCLREETRYGLEIMVEGIEIEEETKYGLTTVDYGIATELQAGKDYWLEYYHLSDPMTLKITSHTKPVVYQADITLPSNLEHIEEGAFEGAGFESVKIPAGVYYVGPRAFANCTNLETLIVYAKIIYFDSTAFDGCNSITVIAANDSKAHDLAVKKGWTFVEMN